MIAVDSSAWIEYPRATESPAHRRLRPEIASGGELAVLDVLQLEVLAGERDERVLAIS